MLGVVAGTSISISIDPAGGPYPLAIIIAAVLAGSLGFLEDLRGLPIAVRAASQLGVGLIVVVAVSSCWWWVPVGGLAIAAYMNIANFMDGVNGMSSVHGFIVGLAVATIGFTGLGPTWMIPAGLVLAGSFIAFLPWNLLPPRVFLGDVGSYVLGAVIATILVSAAMSGVPLLTLLSMVAVYLADTGYTLLSRIARGERWYESHRQHVYHRLEDLGFGHLTCTAIVGGATAVCASIGILSAGSGYWLLPILAIVAICGGYISLPVIFARKQVPRT
ncbi:UDP-phosphate glycosyltransferase [Leifsonia sp. YIM 134122]|uniref:UDP-phosphate glycosyltransferase n=1 Tax=Leifsonia stereocauli TaxID=3134136 RepID=A0ABU9W6J7_9MICO